MRRNSEAMKYDMIAVHESLSFALKSVKLKQVLSQLTVLCTYRKSPNPSPNNGEQVDRTGYNAITPAAAL